MPPKIVCFFLQRPICELLLCADPQFMQLLPKSIRQSSLNGLKQFVSVTGIQSN